MSETPKLPQKTSDDLIYAGMEAIASIIPWAGGPAAVLLKHVLSPPIEQRRNDWISKLAENLQRLESEISGFRMENLKHNNEFIDVILHATQSALRSSSKEKHQALRNAVLNVSLGSSPSALFQQMFVHFIDTLTERHIQILKMFSSPEDWFKAVNKK